MTAPQEWHDVTIHFTDTYLDHCKNCCLEVVTVCCCPSPWVLKTVGQICIVGQQSYSIHIVSGHIAALHPEA